MADQHQERALGRQQLGPVALGLGVGRLGIGHRLVGVAGSHEAGLGLDLGDVGQFAVDPGGLQGVLEVQRQAAGLEQGIGHAGDQRGLGGLVGEGGIVEIGVGLAGGGGPAAPEVQLPADVEGGAVVLGGARRREQLAERTGRAEGVGLGAGGRALDLAGRQPGLVDGLGAHRGGLLQHRQGGLGIGGVLQGLVDQTVELRIVVERPPVVERGRLQPASDRLGRLIARRGRHLGLAHRGGDTAGSQQRRR